MGQRDTNEQGSKERQTSLPRRPSELRLSSWTVLMLELTIPLVRGKGKLSERVVTDVKMKRKLAKQAGQGVKVGEGCRETDERTETIESEKTHHLIP